MSVAKNQPSFAVLLVNLGTPDAPEPAAVRRYLAEFLWDRRVVDVPRPLWWLILNGIILRLRPGKVARNYQKVWTENGSPLLDYTLRQAAALQQMLGEQIRVLPAMTYGQPDITQALDQLQQQGIEKLLVLPLYPQYSSSTTAAVYDQLMHDLNQRHNLPSLRLLRDYHQHPMYIQALADSVRQHWQTHGQAAKLLMSFHGIPQRYADRGDPYARECETTARLLAEALQLTPEQWQLSYQSRFGREPWLLPATDATVQALGEAGTESLQVICPGFSADCLETLEEIALQNRAIYEQAGGKNFSYIAALNDRPEHLQLLQQLVLENSQGWH